MVNIVLLLGLVARATALSSTADAQLWLRAHAAPQADELSELKGENPEAYAIVKALLTKRSLGLLDPKHPSASFSAPTNAPLASEEQGPQAFAKFSSAPSQTIESAAPEEYPEAPVVHKHIDNWNWKPSDSAAEEDAEVKNVLGAVAAVAQQKPKPVEEPSAPEPVASVSAAASDVTTATVVSAPVVAAPISEVQPVVAAAQGNSYLKDIDFGIKAPVAASPSTQENSYLRGSGLVEDGLASKTAQLTQKSVPTQDFLAAFSWGDESAPKAHPQSSLAEATMKVETGTKKTKPKAGNSLFAWLDGKSSSKTAAGAAKPATTAAPQNSYMMDLE